MDGVYFKKYGTDYWGVVVDIEEEYLTTYNYS